MLRLKSLTNSSPSLRGGSDSGGRGNPDQNTINQYSFSYDANSNILSNGENSYAYDTLNRITSALYSTSSPKKTRSETWSYDPMGNRTESKDILSKDREKKDDKEDTDTIAYVTNTLNQYTSTDKTKYAYDKNGNLVNNGKFQFAYDYRNRLVEVRKIALTPNPSPKGEKWGKEKDEKNKRNEQEKSKVEDTLVAKYSYDILGRRLSKETNETITKYVYSNQDAIQEDEYTKKTDGKIPKNELKETREYVYWKGIDDILVMISSPYEIKKWVPVVKKSSTFFYHKNQLWSITTITDEKGKLVEEYRYDAFGKAYTRKSRGDEWKKWKEFEDSRSGNTRLFTGREYDSETDLYYYRARYYSADLGRFISRDPIGMRDNVNLYTYVGNNPVKYVDPMGREKAIIIVGQEKKPWEFNAGIVYQRQKYLSQGFKESNIIQANATTIEKFDSVIHSYNNIASVTFLSHGSSNSLGASASQPMIGENNVSQLSPITNDGGNMCVNTTVSLIACNTWKWANSIGQQIANQLGTTVVAPNAYVSIDRTYPGTMESVFWYRQSGEPTLNNVWNFLTNPFDWTTYGWKQFNPN